MTVQTFRTEGRKEWTAEIEQTLLPTKGHDRYLCRDNFLGVADGATPLLDEWPDSGSFAAFALAALADAAVERGRDTALDVSAVFERAIRRAALAFGWPGPTLSCAVAVVFWHDGHVTAAALGDCTASVLLRDGRTLTVLDSAVTALDEIADLQQGTDKDRARLANRFAMNDESSYWIFSDDASAAGHVTTVSVPEESVAGILLETDGRTAPANTDDSTFVRASPGEALQP
jgi:hypothetical protein